MELRLGNQVVFVRGAVRAALYDLHRRRLVRIPLLVAQWIEESGAINVPQGALETAVIRDLVQRRFIVYERPRNRIPFDTNSAPKIPMLHSIAIEVGPSWKRQLSWSASAIDAGARVVSFFVGDKDKEAVFRLVAPVLLSNRSAVFRAIEVLSGGPGDWSEGEIYDVRGKLVAKRRRVSGVRAFQSKLRVDEVHFSMLWQLSELAGHIFVGSDLEATPHWAEKHVRYGNISDLTAGELLSSPLSKSVWANTKGRRSVCADCELRYACVHPFSDRVDPTDISSAPANCLYDPYSQDSQLSLFS